MRISDHIEAWVRANGDSIRLWTSGGYISGTVIGVEADLLTLECYVNGRRKKSQVLVVVDSISSWA